MAAEHVDRAFGVVYDEVRGRAVGQPVALDAENPRGFGGDRVEQRLLRVGRAELQQVRGQEREPGRGRPRYT